MPAPSSSVKAHAATVLVVGGLLLSAFALYLALSFVFFLADRPELLVYTYLGLAVAQAYWLLFAYLKRRLAS